MHTENLVMAGIHAKLFNSLKMLYEDEETKLRGEFSFHFSFREH